MNPTNRTYKKKRDYYLQSTRQSIFMFYVHMKSNGCSPWCRMVGLWVANASHMTAMNASGAVPCYTLRDLSHLLSDSWDSLEALPAFNPSTLISSSIWDQ